MIGQGIMRRGRGRGAAGAIIALGALLFWPAPPPACAAQIAVQTVTQTSHEDPRAVESAVRSAVVAMAPAHAAITLGPAMGALYMKPCGQALKITITGRQPYLQAAALCAAPRWTLYISARVEAEIPVLVAARPIPAGQPIVAADVTMQEEPMSVFAGRQVFYHPADVVGDLSALTLPAGTILNATTIQRPIVVRSGQIIMVDVRDGAIDITLNARADEPGRVGDLISVTNITSGKIFQATVTQAGAIVQLAR
jgi:flagella basal body P-ring formation protein FlgA